MSATTNEITEKPAPTRITKDYAQCQNPKCKDKGVWKAIHAFELLPVNPNEVSEYGDLRGIATRRDTICRACRGEMKRAANRTRVSDEAGLSMTEITRRKREPKETQLDQALVVASPSPVEPVEPPPPQRTVEAAPASDTTTIEDWVNSAAKGVWHYKAIQVVRDVYDADRYWFYLRKEGFGEHDGWSPEESLGPKNTCWVAHLIARVPLKEPLRGYVYA